MKLEKALKNLDVETVKEIESLSEEDLRNKVVQANQAIEQAEKELEANAEYQDLKESVKAMSAGMKEVRKRQKSIITVALTHLNKE